MKKLLNILSYCLLFSIVAKAQTVSLVVTAPVGGTGFSAPLTIQSNQSVQFLHTFTPVGANPLGDQTRMVLVEVTIGTNTFEYPNGNNTLTVAGPATIQLKINNNPTYSTTCTSFATFKITDNQTQTTPSTAVVIPTDATGPVNILLESSPDLVNWTGALPGTYGASTTNRFFRVRAVRQ